MRSALVLVVSATVMVAACGGGQETTSSSGGAFMSGTEDNHYSAGLAAQRAGNLDVAVQEFRLATDANPSYLAAYLALGSVLLEQENWGAAIAPFERAVELRETTVDAWIGLARAHYYLGDLDPALEAAESAVTHAQEQGRRTLEGESLGVLGMVQIAIEDLEGAIATLEEALRVDATNVEARVSLARLYATVGRNADAIRLLGNASSYEQDTDARLQLGGLFNELGIFDRAIETLQTAYDDEPDNDEVLYYLAEANLGAGNRDVAIQLATQLIDRNPGFADAYVVRGRGQMQRDSMQFAIEDVNSALGIEGDHYGALILLGDIESAQGNTDDARREYERAHESNPLGIEAITKLGQAYYDAGMHSEFIALVEPNMEREDRGDDWLRMLTTAYREVGNMESLIVAMHTLSDDLRDDYELHAETARLAIDNPGILNNQDMVRHAQLSYEQSGGSLEYRLLVIDALVAAGRLEEALGVTESALDAVPGNPGLEERRDMIRDLD